MKRTGTAWDIEQELSERKIVAVSSAWQSFKTNSTTSPDCSATYPNWSSATSGVSAKSVAISQADNNHWVCFRAKNSRGVYGYVKHQIDYNPPVISFTQDNRLLTASSTATDVDSNSWYWIGPYIVTNCHLSRTGWQVGNVINGALDRRYYCFKSFPIGLAMLVTGNIGLI